MWRGNNKKVVKKTYINRGKYLSETRKRLLNSKTINK